MKCCAEVAELADAPGLGPGGSYILWRFESSPQHQSDEFIDLSNQAMFKRLTMPVQVVLLNRGLCVGCTKSLEKSGIRDEFGENKAMVQCSCKRRYVHDLSTDTYRRATRQEERTFVEGIEARNRRIAERR